MSTIKEKANLVAGEIAPKVSKEVAFDPLTLLAIAQVIIGVLTLFNSCFNAATAGSTAEILKQMQHPTILQRLRLRRIIKEKLRENNNKKVLVGELIDPLINQARQLTESDVEEMLAEAKKEE